MSSYPPPTSQGFAPFTLSSTSDDTDSSTTCQTFYKIYGSLSCTSPPTAGKHPLIIVHGGPGSTHDYVLPLVFLHTKYNIPLVFYDQLGSGESTHLPEKSGELGKAFWTEEVFMDQLDSLVKHLGLETQDDGDKVYDILGHSWGGMLIMRWAARRQPKGLRKLVVSNSPASMELFVEGTLKLRKELPEEVQKALNEHEAAGTTDTPEYHAAEQAFYDRHLCRVKPLPEGLMTSFTKMQQDATVYHIMNGPSEFFVTGTLKPWSIIPDLPLIATPALLLNGRHDEVQESAVRPIFEGLKRVKWVVLEEASHLSFVEVEERYGEVVNGFLRG
ncbi:Alpha/Beta hydrolase protein [Irpex rosettiformis]|uniref:Alpha/Beta hydrolase protein n=1 Tax=Irpex rosettiformis TaxID=378272 RepID=A0ACB8TUU4_9APHY|nr:Alpha/Beta hydrolase protein [Irpex rosettiformis]